MESMDQMVQEQVATEPEKNNKTNSKVEMVKFQTL